MPLIQCSECGNNYPDRIAACPKCGAVIPNEKKIDTQLKMLRTYFTVGLLLVFIGIFGMTHFSVFTEAENLFLLSFIAALAGTLLSICVFVLFLFSKGYKKASYLIFLSIIGITAVAFFWLVSSSYKPDYEGTLEDAIPYAENIISLLNNYKSITGDYPYRLDYLDVDLNNMLRPTERGEYYAYGDEPITLSRSYKWIGYYLITTEEFVLCVEERDKNADYYSSIMYSSRDRQWIKSDCSVYHERSALQTSGVDRDAVVINKEVVSRKLTRYTVEFQDGETIEILDRWPYFSVGECVKIFLPDNFSPRIAIGDDCWKK